MVTALMKQQFLDMLAYNMMVSEKTHNFTAIYQVLLELCAAAIWQQQQQKWRRHYWFTSNRHGGEIPMKDQFNKQRWAAIWKGPSSSKSIIKLQKHIRAPCLKLWIAPLWCCSLLQCNWEPGGKFDYKNTPSSKNWLTLKLKWEIKIINNGF